MESPHLLTYSCMNFKIHSSIMGNIRPCRLVLFSGDFIDILTKYECFSCLSNTRFDGAIILKADWLTCSPLIMIG